VKFMMKSRILYEREGRPWLTHGEHEKTRCSRGYDGNIETRLSSNTQEYGGLPALSSPMTDKERGIKIS
jgi:hypothetical protein